MNKALWAVIAAIVIIGGGAIIYATNHKSNTSSNNTSSSYGTNNTSGSNASSGTGSQNTKPANSNNSTSSVSIANFAFSPNSLTVKKGTKVTWTNNDSTTHTVTETDNQTGPDSGNLSPGGNYSFTFNTAGTFHYHCSIHPEMTGTVTVTE